MVFSLEKKQDHHGIVITKTPFRVSFFGGGTDLPEFFNQYGGSVLGTTVNQYLYVTMNSLKRFYDKKIRMSYSKLECVDNAIDLEHDLARTILHDHVRLGKEEFLDIHTFADLPASSGIGSSSTFTVGMLNALYTLSGVYKTPQQIASEAVHIEREKLKEAGGWQDQYFAACGGFNKIDFLNNQVEIIPMILEPQKMQALEESCLMVFTGGIRSSANIQEHFQDTSARKIDMLIQTKNLVAQAVDILASAPTEEALVQEFGHLLHQAWLLKRGMSEKISNNQIDFLYEQALKAGAYGGKVCGAGGGGFLLLIVPTAAMNQVKSAMSAYHQLSLKFDLTGSRVLYGDIR